MPRSGLNTTKRLASGLPKRPATPLDISREVYHLQMRRRNLALKRHMTQQKLARLDEQIGEIDAQLAALGQVAAPPADDTASDYSFDLSY